MTNQHKKNLFREAAREAQSTQVFGEIVFIRPLSLSFLASFAGCAALAVVLFFWFGTYTRRVVVEGVVMPDTGLVKIFSRQSGVVLERHVAEGQRVTGGTLLFTVSTDLQSAAEGETEAAIIAEAHRRRVSLQQEIEKTRLVHTDERSTLETRISGLRTQLTDIDSEIAAQRDRTSLAADAAARYAGLLAKDYISKDQAQQREADLLDQKSKLNSLQRDRASIAQSLSEAVADLSALSLKQQNELAKLDRSVMEVDQSLIESEARRELAVTSPEDGTATAVIAEPGQMVDTSHPLASIVPAGAHWQAYLYVPSAAVGFVHIGDPVLVRYQAYPYQKFGQYPAHVVSIARTALSAAELEPSAGSTNSVGTFYRIIVALESQTVTAYGRPQPLEAGMTLQADILQEQRRLYEWVLEPLYSMTGNL